MLKKLPYQHKPRINDERQRRNVKPHQTVVFRLKAVTTKTWVAVYCENESSVYYFDSFGSLNFIYPPFLKPSPYCISGQMQPSMTFSIVLILWPRTSLYINRYLLIHVHTIVYILFMPCLYESLFLKLCPSLISNTILITLSQTL